MSSEDSKVLFDRQGKKIEISDIESVCREHRLGTFIQMIGILGSSTNTILLIETSKGKFIVRFVTYPPSLERLLYIEETILYLKKSSLPVATAIMNNSNEYFSLVNNKMIQVYPYIKGLRYRDNPNQIQSSARMLSKFHDALINYQNGPLPTDSIYPTVGNLEKRLNRLIQNEKSISSSSISKINQLHSGICNHWEKAEKSNLMETIIHDDWHPWNQLFNKKGTVVGILDFECIRHGKRIYDIAYAIYHIYTHSAEKVKHAKMFLEGYGRMTTEEKSILSLVIAKVAMFFIIKDASYVEKNLHVNESFIYYLLSQEGRRFLS